MLLVMVISLSWCLALLWWKNWGSHFEDSPPSTISLYTDGKTDIRDMEQLYDWLEDAQRFYENEGGVFLVSFSSMIHSSALEYTFYNPKKRAIFVNEISLY